MIRDPLYKQIIAGLQEHVDPEAFEQCAADLLRDTYPGLVPIRGGSDDGMDGAIADKEGPPLPLVCTTKADVIGNFTASLKSYKKSGRTARKAVLATSRELTPRRRRNLEKRAQDLGFVLRQTHTQSDIADRLYRNPQWCMDLLRLSGDPPALSIMPATSRPILTDDIVGREDDLSWLRNTVGDLLVYGQPGVGKTQLLRRFALESGGLFTRTADREQLAQGIRSQKPNSLIVDDAHVCPAFLTELRQLREDVHADFQIIATSWPGQHKAVAKMLLLSSTNIRELELLTRDEIVEVINASGIYGPAGLVHEIVDQANGRPGLAATLCDLCLRGDVRDVASGDAIFHGVRTLLERSVTTRAFSVLAGFAVGGASGMEMNAVADCLGVQPIDLRDIVTNVAPAGVVNEIGTSRLCVQPAALGHALLREVFFAGPGKLEIEGLLGRVPSVDSAALALIGACARGANVPSDLVRRSIQKCSAEDVWCSCAWQGRAQCEWILEQYPSLIVTIARPALEHLTGTAIPMLMRLAVGDQRELHSHVDHGLRIIGDWIKAGKPGTAQAVDRRKRLLECCELWLKKRGDPAMGMKAMCVSLSPEFRDSETDPGAGDRVTMRFGLLLKEELRQVMRFWPRFVTVMRGMDVENWEPVLDVVEGWVYPGRIPARVPENVHRYMRSCARKMIRDIASLGRGHNGLLSTCKRLAMHLRCKFPIPVDPEFEILFPARSITNRRSRHRKQLTSLQGLAAKWKRRRPSTVAKKLMDFEREAAICENVWPRLTPALCLELARIVRNPVRWGTELLEHGASSQLVEPFLKQAAGTNDPNWFSLAEQCLKKPHSCQAATSVILTRPCGVSPSLVAKAVESIENDSWVRFECSAGRIPERIMKLLLQHHEDRIAAATALGMGEADKEVHQNLQALWRRTIVERVRKDFGLKRLFLTDPSLAFEWLEARIKGQSSEYDIYCEACTKDAITVLANTERSLLLKTMSPGSWCHRLVRLLVDRDLQLYKQLLESKRLRRLHLLPLKGDPEGKWIDMALLAVEAGYSVERVVGAAYGDSYAYTGPPSAFWEGWCAKFASLCDHENSRVQEIGRVGRDGALASQREALKQERYEAVHGRHQ